MIRTLTAWPSGVMKAMEQARATPMASARGSSPACCAAWMATGVTMLATAAPLITWVSNMASSTRPASSAVGPKG